LKGGDIMDNKNIFASNLKRYMESNNKSRREVSEALGVSYYTFSDWVNGKKYPRMDKVEKLADYFGILKSDLIEEKTIENSPVEMAERHFEIIMDEDIADMFDDFKVLDGQQRKLVKDLVHNLAHTKKSEA
jgi:transcriptional regulator with XRE-family HTH domain